MPSLTLTGLTAQPSPRSNRAHTVRRARGTSMQVLLPPRHVQEMHQIPRAWIERSPLTPRGQHFSPPGRSGYCLANAPLVLTHRQRLCGVGCRHSIIRHFSVEPAYPISAPTKICQTSKPILAEPFMRTAGGTIYRGPYRAPDMRRNHRGPWPWMRSVRQWWDER
jgi:hypothetical protein